MASTRQAFVWAFFGATGSGKTSTAIQMTRDWIKSHKGCNVIGFDPHDIFKREGLLTHYITENDDNWATILATRICTHCNKIKHPDKEECVKCGKNSWKFKFANSLLVMDDYRNLLTANSTPADVLSLLGLKRRIGLDIIYIMHNPKLLLERFAYYTTNFSVFYTQSTAGDFSDKIAQYVPCQKAANIINQYVQEIGGVDDERYTKMYPDFPYVMVTNVGSQLHFMNMDDKIVSKLKREGKI